MRRSRYLQKLEPQYEGTGRGHTHLVAGSVSKYEPFRKGAKAYNEGLRANVYRRSNAV